MPATPVTKHEQESRGIGMQLAFEKINEPGCYVCNWSGHLLRVPEDSIKPGRSPLISITACETPYVTKISENPFQALSAARKVAADFDLAVNF